MESPHRRNTTKPERRPDRFVRVDLGHGPAEHWVEGKVVSTRTCLELFGDGTTTELLVEIPGGERLWVSFWEEIRT